MKKIFLSSWLMLLTALAGNSQTVEDYNRIYNAFRNNQFNFPSPPKQIDTVYVGEWDAAQSDPDLSFHGIKGGIVDPHGSVHTVTHIPGLGYSFSSKYTLKFKLKNNHPGNTTYISINGTGYNFPSGKNEIFIFINTLSRNITWKISSGAGSYGDLLTIVRVPVVVTGVFRIPMMPVMVIYEPPANENMTNKATYTKINMFGSESRLSLYNDNSQTKSEAEFTDVDVIKGYLKVEGMVLSSIPDAKAKIGGAVLTLLSNDALWGGVNTASTKGVIKDHELSVVTELLNSSSINTDVNNGGPGIGDIVMGVYDARFLWMINDGKFSATMLDFRMPFQYTASAIKDSITNGSRKELFRNLARVDPYLTFGTTFNLRGDNSRFKYLNDIGGDFNGNAANDFAQSYALLQSDRNTEIKYTVDVEDYKKGFLSYLNIGQFNENETYRSEIRNTITNQVSNGTLTTATISIQHNEDEHRVYEVFFDRIYGTFAVQDPSKVAPVSTKPPGKGINTGNVLIDKTKGN